MTDLSNALPAPAGKSAGTSRKALVLPLFAATLFLSAFLLFSVQPYFTKIVLPRLGGSPGVWSVAMVFFQAVLLAGYGYAHLLVSKFTVRTAALIHLAVMVAALFFLPTAVPESWSNPPETGHAFWLLGLFAVVIGLPFFAVSANGPLLQAWFSRTGHAHADDPYFLYGASNIGSFASLILYIIMIEPLATLDQQGIAWTTGFVMLGLFIALCAFFPSYLANTNKVEATPQTAKTATPISWIMRGQWILYSAVPSALLVAVTSHLSVDVASIPFLWVVPLALFLLTFVIAFARKPIVSANQISVLLPYLTAAVVTSLLVGPWLPLSLNLAIHFAFFFAATLMSHSILVEKRPAAENLTNFYFWMSLGGVLGGAFTTLLAPALFNTVAEYPLLIALAFALRPSFWRGDRKESGTFIAIGAIILIVLALPMTAQLVKGTVNSNTVYLTALGLAAVLAVIHHYSQQIAMVLMASVCGLALLVQGMQGELYIERSFFGVLSAKTANGGASVVMNHGTTLHGAMLVGETGKPTPITYYHESGGIAKTLFAVQDAKQNGPANVGIIGLGLGSMLCHRREGEAWSLYEIDSKVIELAKRDDIFHFMSRCSGASDEMIIGDARLSLVDEPDAKFDYLLVDAFSSNSIPVHLLTVEALKLYKSKLSENGLLAIHVSNRQMELTTVVAAVAKEAGLVGVTGSFQVPEGLEDQMISVSGVVTLAKNRQALLPLRSDPAWEELDAKNTRAWSDNYSNVLAAIWRKSFGS